MNLTDIFSLIVGALALIGLVAGSLWVDSRCRQRRGPNDVRDGRGEA